MVEEYEEDYLADDEEDKKTERAEKAAEKGWQRSGRKRLLQNEVFRRFQTVALAKTVDKEPISRDAANHSKGCRSFAILDRS